ncbi:MAG TPA: 50S ribosomal protein L6, partial [Candidatus Mcinerneyibacteriales bacterium]|nr:50S ribosomal protein L6 [Candidatus Mcinerneyibacteriales bacterium]
MSRIGNRILSIPSGVTVAVSKSNEVTVKGPLGELSRQFDMAMKITVENDTIKV